MVRVEASSREFKETLPPRKKPAMVAQVKVKCATGSTRYSPPAGVHETVNSNIESQETDQINGYRTFTNFN